MSLIKKYQQPQSSFTPPPGYKPRPFINQTISPAKSKEELEAYRKENEGGEQQRAVAQFQLGLNRTADAVLNLSLPTPITGNDLTREVMAQNNNSSTSNFIRNTLPIITNASAAQLSDQVVGKFLPKTNSLITIKKASPVVSKSVVDDIPLKSKGDTPQLTLWDQLRTPNEITELQEKAKSQVSDYINHPTVQQTFKKNSEIAQRLKTNNRSTTLYDWSLNRPLKINIEKLPNRVGAQYQHGSSEITMNSTIHGISSDDAVLRDARHEWFHHAGFGTSRIEDLKTLKLLKPRPQLLEHGKQHNLLSENGHYLEDYGELFTNARDLAHNLNIKIGDPYPGRTEFVKKMNTPHDKSFVASALRLNDPNKAIENRNFKRVWDFLTGRYAIAPIATASTTSLLNKH